MKAHYLDVLILLLALLGVITVTILEYKYLSDSSEIPPNSGDKDETDVEVACFPPSHFEAAQAAYATNVCKGFWKTGDVYDPFSDHIPMEDEEKIRNKQPGWKQPKSDEQEDKSLEESNLKRLLLGQIIVAVLAFILLQTVIILLATRVRSIQFADDKTPDVAEDDNKTFHREEKRDSISRNKKVLKQMSRSRSLTIVYCVILLIFAIAWFILATKSYCVLDDRKGETEPVKCENCTNGEESDKKETDIFMCNFQLRQLGNVQRYTVQCVANIQQPQTETRAKVASPGGVFAAEMNTALCFTIACLLLIHLLYTLVGAPVLNKLVSGGKIQILSDAHLMSAVHLV